MHSHNHFLLPALAPILFDVGILFGVAFLIGPFGVYGIAWGAVIGAVGRLLDLTEFVQHEHQLEVEISERKRAMDELNGKDMGGRALRVNEANEQRPRGGGG